MLRQILRDAGGWNAIHRASFALAIKALPAVYGLGSLLFLIRFLPVADYGRYGLAIAYINLTALVSWGLWSVPLVRALPGAEREGVIGPVTWFMLSSALTASLLALLILPALQVGWEASLWTAGTVLVFVPRLLAYALAQADAKNKAAFGIDAAYYLGSVTGYFVLALTGHLNSVETVMRIIFFSACLAACVALLNYGKSLRLRAHGNWKFVAKYGSWTGVQSFGEIYMHQGDIMLIGALTDPVRIAPYVAARSLLRLYGMLSQAVNFMVLPVASKLAAEGDYVRLRKKIRSALLTIWAIVLPLNMVLFLLADSLLPFVLGQKYVAAVPYFKIILGATFFEPVYNVLSNALVGIGQARKVAMLIWIGLGVNATVNILLVSRYGMDAVPWILVATYICFSLAFVLISRKDLSSENHQKRTQ
jgi:O-antigen/teichoic acid export membrane protein